MHGRKRDTDREKGCVDTRGDGEGETNWESRIDIYTLLCVKQTEGNCCITHGAQLGVLLLPRGKGWGG